MPNKYVRSLSAVVTALSVMVGVIGTARADLTIPYGTGTTTYAFMNVSTTNATVVITYYYPNGTQAYSSTENNVIPYKRMNVTVGSGADGAVPTNFTIGNVVLSSDQDLVAVAATDFTGLPPYESNTNSNPNMHPGTEMGMYAAFNSGSTELYAPFVIRVQRGATTNSNLGTKITLQNTTSVSPALAYMNYYTQAGSLVGTVVKSIPAYGSVVVNTLVDSDVPAGFVGPASQGSVYVTSTQPLVGVTELHWDNIGGNQNWIVNYNMAMPASAAYQLFAPVAQRICNPPAQLCSPTQYNYFKTFTNYVIQNTESATAYVTATFIGTTNPLGGSGSTSPVNYSFSFQIPGKSLYAINLFLGGDVQGATQTNLFAEGTGLGSQFQGTLSIKSSTKVVGIGMFQQPASIQNYSSAFALAGSSDATSKLFGPWFDRVCTSTCDPNQLDQWINTSFAIMNVDTVSTTLNSIDFYDATGTKIQSYTVDGNGNPLNIGPGAAIAWNSRVGGNFSTSQIAGLTNSFNGTFVVNGAPGAKLKALVTLVKGMDSADMYNALNR
ncbi:MAG: hypothetical protein M1140_03335 [Chloroflexi bacterium]|nr:hypothetical protein [Chloroflexota bacterium]